MSSVLICSLAFMFSTFFKDMLSRSAENLSAKSEQFAVDFVDFGRSESCLFSHFGGPGAHFGGPGAHYEDFWDCSDFRGVPDTKTPIPFGGTFGDTDTLLAVLVFAVFLSALFS